jgi:hypothetical protein
LGELFLIHACWASQDCLHLNLWEWMQKAAEGKPFDIFEVELNSGNSGMQDSCGGGARDSGHRAAFYNVLFR